MKIKLTAEKLKILRKAPNLRGFVLNNYTGNELKEMLNQFHFAIVERRSVDSVYAVHARAFEACVPKRNVKQYFTNVAIDESTIKYIQINDSFKIIMKEFYENHNEIITHHPNTVLSKIINYDLSEHWTVKKLAPYLKNSPAARDLTSHIKINYWGRDIASAAHGRSIYLGPQEITDQIYNCFCNDFANEAHHHPYGAKRIAEMSPLGKIILIHNQLMKRIYKENKDKILANPWQSLEQANEIGKLI